MRGSGPLPRASPRVQSARPPPPPRDPTPAARPPRETAGGKGSQTPTRLTRALAVGAAVVTAAGGDLPAEFVIHTVIRSESEPVSRSSVTRAWRAALQQAQEWQFAHLSVPPIGTGAGNLTIEDAAEIMATVLHVHL